MTYTAKSDSQHKIWASALCCWSDVSTENAVRPFWYDFDREMFDITYRMPNSVNPINRIRSMWRYFRSNDRRWKWKVWLVLVRARAGQHPMKCILKQRFIYPIYCLFSFFYVSSMFLFFLEFTFVFVQWKNCVSSAHSIYEFFFSFDYSQWNLIQLKEKYSKSG